MLNDQTEKRNCREGLSLGRGQKQDEIVQKENEYAADEIQPVAIEESGFESDSSISAEYDFINDKKVSTHKSLFAIDLLGDFIVLNIPTILCTLDIAKKKRN